MSDFSRTPAAPWLSAFSADELIDLSAGRQGEAAAPVHPLQLLEHARAVASAERELLERALAIEWCGRESEPLYVDGGIGGEDAIAGASNVVGVVKSHRTMYVSGDALETVLALRQGERSSAFVLAPRGHSSVMSWYLRLHDPARHGALWGLVRVEVAQTDDVTGRADAVSRWILAERLPLALPDARWDTMAYGIRGVEEYLRALG